MPTIKTNKEPMKQEVEFVNASKMKASYLEKDGMQPIGIIYQHPKTNARATLDIYGRVQWWDTDGSGRMVSMDRIKIICDKCGNELTELGGLAFSPPDSTLCHKKHLCVDCYDKFLTWSQKDG